MRISEALAEVIGDAILAGRCPRHLADEFNPDTATIPVGRAGFLLAYQIEEIAGATREATKIADELRAFSGWAMPWGSA